MYSGRPECVGCCEGEGILLGHRVVGKYDYVGGKCELFFIFVGRRDWVREQQKY